MGVVAVKETAEAINQAIDTLLEMDLTVLKHNAKKAAKANSWELQEEKMLAVYQRLLEPA